MNAAPDGPETVLTRLRTFQASGKTLPLSFRLQSLRRFESVIRKRENDIFEALRSDLKRPSFEAYGADVGIVLAEIRHAVKNLQCWAKTRRVRTPLISFPSRCSVRPVPYGVCLVLSPWNFPFLLSLAPLTGAVAAGNCVVLKPSSQAARSAVLIAQIIAESFEPDHVAVWSGNRNDSAQLLTLPFDKIFFTGGPEAGKEVLRAAAENLTPVTLELGGKNPCIVDATADIPLSARRIAWGKFFNAGQSCVAPDYVWAHANVRAALVQHIIKEMEGFFGNNPGESPDFGRIVSPRHFDRVCSLLKSGKIVAGGGHDRASSYIAPTVLDSVKWSDPVMNEEIFGPILPVLEFTDMSEVVQTLKGKPKPLSLYLFSKDRKTQERFEHEVPYGGGCVNDVMFQFIGPHLPFGGVGQSGMGRYHGKASFDDFSHYKSILKNTFLFDFPIRYAPYKGKLGLLKRLLG